MAQRHTFNIAQVMQTEINKRKAGFNCILEQMDCSDIYRLSHPTATEWALFSTEHRAFSRLCHVLVLKTSLDKF